MYRDHLAAAALLFALLHEDDLNSARQLIAEEQRSFGWSFLEGDAGQRAESAFGHLFTALNDL
jgi:hypothetical protein